MLRLPKQYVDDMVKHAMEDDPDECCGIIAGRNGKATKFYRMTNVEHSPYRYSMDNKVLNQVIMEIDDSGWEVMAIYHSHTHTEAYPSATDVRLASWPDAFYILISLQNKTKAEERSLRTVDGSVEVELQFSVVIRSYQIIEEGVWPSEKRRIISVPLEVTSEE